MNQNWYIIEDFSFGDTSEHLKIFEFFLQNLESNYKILFRRSILKYCELPSWIQTQLADENQEYLGDAEFDKIYKKENLRFCGTDDVSFENFAYKLDIQVGSKFEWYEMKSPEEIKTAISVERLYDAIITDDLDDFTNFSYYINFVEKERFNLAINDAQNKITDILQQELAKAFKKDYNVFKFNYTESEHFKL